MKMGQSISTKNVSDWDPCLTPIADDMQGAPINVHKLMAHNPALLKAWWSFRNHSVNGGSLGSRSGELVILRVAVHLSAWYEWGSHVDRALRCGLSLIEIEAVLDRSIGPEWATPDAALLCAVDDLIQTHQISQPTLAKLETHFDTAQIMDVIAIHGMYVILGCMIKTWGLPLDDAVQERISGLSSEAAFETAARSFHKFKHPD